MLKRWSIIRASRILPQVNYWCTGWLGKHKIHFGTWYFLYLKWLYQLQSRTGPWRAGYSYASCKLILAKYRIKIIWGCRECSHLSDLYFFKVIGGDLSCAEAVYARGSKMTKTHSLTGRGNVVRSRHISPLLLLLQQLEWLLWAQFSMYWFQIIWRSLLMLIYT